MSRGRLDFIRCPLSAAHTRPLEQPPLRYEVDPCSCCRRQTWTCRPSVEQHERGEPMETSTSTILCAHRQPASQRFLSDIPRPRYGAHCLRENSLPCRDPDGHVLSRRLSVSCMQALDLASVSSVNSTRACALHVVPQRLSRAGKGRRRVPYYVCFESLQKNFHAFLVTGSY